MLQILALILSLILASTASQHDCQAKAGFANKNRPCIGSLYGISNECRSRYINIADTAFYKCSSVHIQWDNPMHNLTITIESADFTPSKIPFIVTFEGFLGIVPHIYRVDSNGKETEIATASSVPAGNNHIQKSDQNFRVILKLQFENRPSMFLVMINYKITAATNAT